MNTKISRTKKHEIITNDNESQNCVSNTCDRGLSIKSHRVFATRNREKTRNTELIKQN